MNKVMLMILLVVFFPLSGHAGENQDKRKAKNEARMQEQRARAQEANQEKMRDVHAEDVLYREIQAQERLLSQLRRRLHIMHENNSRKYGSGFVSSQERSSYTHQTRGFDYAR